MPERVLPENLSGEEVVTAILDKIGSSLRRDCFLIPTTSYEKFWCRVKIEVRCTDAGRMPEVNQDVTVTNLPNPEDACLDASEAEFEIQEAPPNEVRVSTGQDVPVLTRDTEGKPSIKPVRYSRKQLEKATNVARP